MKELGRGNEGIVYQDGTHAKKVFYSQRKLSKRTTAIGMILSRINWKSFMRPFNFVLNRKGLISTYEMDIMPDNNGEKFTEMEIPDLVAALRRIRSDIDVMTDNNIRIKDFQLHNVRVLKKDIKFYDFSLFRFGFDKERLRAQNYAQMDDLFGSVGIQEENPDINPIDVYDKFYSKYLSSDYTKIEDYIENEIHSETLRKHLIKK